MTIRLPAQRTAFVAWALLVAVGCASNESLARDKHSSIHLGMTKDEVRAAIGEPFSIVRDSGTSFPETWAYVFGIKNMSSEKTWGIIGEVAIVVGAVGTFVALLLSGRGVLPEGVQHSDSGADSQSRRTWRFSVFFGVDGRVAELSEVW